MVCSKKPHNPSSGEISAKTVILAFAKVDVYIL